MVQEKIAQSCGNVEFIDEVPKTSVGKFSKKNLRDRFADVLVD